MKKTILLLSLTATLFACKNTTNNSNDNKLLFEKSMAVKDYQSAIVAIQYMLLKDSTLSMYEDTLPELYVATSNVEAADYYTNRVLVRKPNDERFLQIKALCAQQKGKIEEEFDIYNKLFASTKKLSYLYQITAFQFSTGQMEQAVKNLAELETKATPKDSVDFAVSESEKQKVPLRAAVYNMKAYMQAQSRDLMGAKKYFEMALKEYPDFVMAKRNLQQLMQGGRQQ